MISVDLDEVRFPDETIGELEMVRHSGASAVVPLLDRGRELQVVLVRQYRYAADGYIYEIPAGRLAPGETPESCASRELKEETGYSAGGFRKLTTIYTTPGFTDERIHLFVAERLTPGKPAHEPDEFLELHLVSLSEAVDMVKAGKVVDAKTCIALLLAESVLDSQ
ncbi:MAG: NUDIX hydrolase [Gemmatimonadaceae bacterium]